MQLLGIHHLTAVSADPHANIAFYTKMLGMRLVKKSVNQDDTTAYHLFYADGLASPGSDLTFFDFRTLPEKRGTHSITRTGLRVAGAATLHWWKERLSGAGVRTGEIATRDGRLTLDVEDGEGQRLALIDDGGTGFSHPWAKSPVPAQHQIRGLGPITMSVPVLAPTENVLTGVLNMHGVRDYDRGDGVRVHVFAMGEGGPGAELHVEVEPDAPRMHPGSGGVHHVAFRSPDADYEAWAKRLADMNIRNSGPIDRYYFQSLYLREPGGVLFEIATEGPGFTADEPLETLGERLALPPFLEPKRAEIEAKLKPI
jgi:glyoxalase family protein